MRGRREVGSRLFDLQVEELILGKLEEQAREGFSSGSVEAAINSNEFALRENNTGSFPRGLGLMLRAASAWIYDRDPFRALQWSQDLENFKVSCWLLCEHLHQSMSWVSHNSTCS